MAEAIRFDDGAPDDKIRFINAARVHHPSADPMGAGSVHRAPISRWAGGATAV